jgi:hypothetical protein
MSQIVSLIRRRVLLDLGMIDSFGNVASEDIKWKQTRWTASPYVRYPLHFKSR